MIPICSRRSRPLELWPPRCLAVLVIVSAVCLLAGCGQGRSEPRGSDARRNARFLIGHWSGDLRQAGLPAFRVRVDIRSVAPSADNTVSYSGIDCSGRWTYLGAQDGRYRFREVIDRGRGGECKGVGEVTLRRLRGGRLAYTFRGGGVESRGTLVRRP